MEYPAYPVFENCKSQPTPGFQRILKRAVFPVKSAAREKVFGANEHVAIYGERDSHAVDLLNEHDGTRL